MGNSQTYGQTVKDSGGESASFGFTIGAVTALTLPGLLSAATDFEEALDGIVLGTVHRKVMTVFDNSFDPAINTAAANQKENRWLARYKDNVTGQKYRIEFPTADLSLLPIDGGTGLRSEYLDLSADPGLLFKTKFEGFVKSPGNYVNAVTLQSMQFVAR
jgi:hypothetical protein